MTANVSSGRCRQPSYSSCPRVGQRQSPRERTQYRSGPRPKIVNARVLPAGLDSCAKERNGCRVTDGTAGITCRGEQEAAAARYARRRCRPARVRRELVLRPSQGCGASRRRSPGISRPLQANKRACPASFEWLHSVDRGGSRRLASSAAGSRTAQGAVHSGSARDRPWRHRCRSLLRSRRRWRQRRLELRWLMSCRAAANERSSAALQPLRGSCLI